MTQPSPPLPIAIIGAGPAGLMAAEMISAAGYSVDIYDAMPSPARKFLMAGKSGLNITHAEDEEIFRSRYKSDDWLPELVSAFGPQDVINWMKGLGIDPHTGPTGRVFPTMMKASPLLRAWLGRLTQRGVQLYTRHRWIGWGEEGQLLMETPEGRRNISSAATVFALGGASWSRLGSDGAWAEHFRQKEIALAAFLPSNGGFLVPWSEKMKDHAGKAVKNVRLTTNTPEGAVTSRSEFVITARGLESGGIYSLSAGLREQIMKKGAAILTLDLLPDISEQKICRLLSRPQGKQSMSNHLRKTLRLTGVKKTLLYEGPRIEELKDPTSLAARIKSLPLTLTGTTPLDEAISTAGGLRFDALDDDLMLRALPGTFCAGEMLDWDAPTGGYLLTACLATGRRAGEGAVKWLLDRGVQPLQTRHVQ